MATIDPSIALNIRPPQIENPMNALARVMQIKGLQQDQQLGQMKMDEYRRGIEDQQALRSALSAPDADPYKVLLQRGKVKEATEFAKGKSEIDAKGLETAKKRIDLMGSAFGHVRQNPTLENAISVLNYLGTNQALSPEQVAQYTAQVQQNPKAIGQLADQAFRAALSAKDQLAKYETRDTGGAVVTQAIDPVSGKISTAGTLQKTISPDAALSAETQRRGQNMTDARARELNEINRQAARTQVIETPEGVMLVDKGTGQARPATANGQPLPGKQSESVKKELVGIGQQRSIVDGAIAAVQKTPSAFSFTRGAATMAGAMPESLAGRLDSDEERQARAYVFNNVSKVINERAGAAQSAQELARLRSFLPAETDNAEQIVSKLNAFKTYLADMESGMKGGSPKSNSAYTDPDKERRYQEWKARQGGKQ